MFVIAGLDRKRLSLLQNFEKESGLKVLALTPLKVQPAPLSQEELKRIQQLEEQLGVCLLAVK